MTGANHQSPGRPFEAGEKATAARLNGRFAPLEASLRGAAVSRTAEPPARPYQLARMRITANAGDYLTCVRYVTDAEGAEQVSTESVLVAKPPELRNSVTSLGSATYSYSGTDARTATVGGDTESQVVVPPWTTGTDIMVERGIGGGTGVTVDAVAVQWQARANGRAWAKAAGS